MAYSGGEQPAGRAWLVPLSAALLLAGCETYAPRPATEESLARDVAPPEAAQLAREAANLKHPLLGPVEIGADGSMTPQGAAVVAVIQNPSLRAARAQRGVAAAQLLQAGILPNPQLSLSMDFPISGATNGTLTAYGVGASWDVTALITHEQEQLAAAHAAQAVNLEVAWQEWQVALGAKLHAARALWLTRECKELESQVSQAEEVLQASRENTREGLQTVIDEQAAAAMVEKRRSALLASRTELSSEQGMLCQAMGLPIGTPVRLVEEPGEASPAPGERWVDEAISNSRLDLAALRAGYASQESKVHAAVQSQFPKIGLGFTRARDTSDVGTIGFGITLDLPVFDRGQGRIGVERATRQQLFEELAARTFDAKADAMRAREELMSLEPQIEQASRTADRLTELAETLKAARTEGLTDAIQENQAAGDAADARLGVMNLRRQQDELRIGLEAATGRLLEGAMP
ncbi:MAG: hypothetical protein GC200_02870 [Tepidisphaera sp.]|nr:hypothetical protein [Tepidisphaera sp.]